MHRWNKQKWKQMDFFSENIKQLWGIMYTDTVAMRTGSMNCKNEDCFVIGLLNFQRRYLLTWNPENDDFQGVWTIINTWKSWLE